MRTTEHDMTIAVDAAARHIYSLMPQPNLDAQRAATFDELHPLVKLQLREQILGPVVAALAALPDRSAHDPLHRGEGVIDCSCGDYRQDGTYAGDFGARTAWLDHLVTAVAATHDWPDTYAVDVDRATGDEA